MPPKKEEWEVRFEEYRNTLISLGARIKNEKALKMAFKLYGEERMPARIYQNCVEEPAATKSPTKEATDKRKTSAAEQPSSKPQPKDKKQTTFNSFEDLAGLPRDKIVSEHTETTPKTEENKEKKPRKTQRERFEEYKKRLQEKGFTINDEAGLWETFRSIRGHLSNEQIRNFVTPPERNPRSTTKDTRDSERRNDRKTEKTSRPNNRENSASAPKTPENSQKKETVDKPTPPKQQSPDKTPFEEYRKNLLDQGYEITNLNTLARLYVKGKGFIAPEELSKLVHKKEERPQAEINNMLVPVAKEESLPAVIEASFADRWVKPLKEYCQKDLDGNGQPKRTVTAVKADKNSVVIDVVPAESYAAENPQDAGVRYSFEKSDRRGSVKVNMGAKDGGTPDYEYFRMMMEANRKNGIKIISFKDIKTEEFRDKLLAAALEFDMKVKGAPEKINVNAPYLKSLPNKVKIKLGIYNGDITPGKNVEQIKESLQKKQAAGDKEQKTTRAKPMLALPARIPPREMD